MAAGLFELRKDPITGWWVATVVDRAFHRDRFEKSAEQVAGQEECQNCVTPPGDGVRMRILKDYAFNVVGTEDQAREMERSLAQVALAQGRAAGSWRTVVAPPREHRPLHAAGSGTIHELLSMCRDAVGEGRRAGQTDYLQVVQNWGAQAGARTNHLCIDRRPATDPPRGRGAGGGSLVIGRRCVLRGCTRRGLGGALSGRRRERRFAACSVRVWVVPTRGRFGRTADVAAGRHPPGARPLATLGGPPVLVIAPLWRRRRDLPLALGAPSPPSRDRRPGAWHRAAGQSGLARGGGRGPPSPGPSARPGRVGPMTAVPATTDGPPSTARHTAPPSAVSGGWTGRAYRTAHLGIRTRAEPACCSATRPASRREPGTSPSTRSTPGSSGSSELPAR
jgi:hypothetical protein